jgi:hypothetical protein
VMIKIWKVIIFDTYLLIHMKFKSIAFISHMSPLNFWQSDWKPLECCSEILENTNVTFNSNDTVTYVPKRRVQAEPEISPRDAHADWIIVPNVALLVSCPSQRDVALYSKTCTVPSWHINK